MIEKTQYYAYRVATETVPPTQQIVLLYEGAVRFMQQAKEAITQNDITKRYNSLAKAGAIIMGLQNSLDFDTGGEVARILHDFYARIDMEIISVHQSNSADMCERVVRQLKQMRDAWVKIDTMQASRGAGDKAIDPAALQAALPSDVLSGIALSA